MTAVSKSLNLKEMLDNMLVTTNNQAEATSAVVDEPASKEYKIQKMENAPKHIFWKTLRDYVTKVRVKEIITEDGVTYLKFGKVAFAAQDPVCLRGRVDSDKDSSKLFNVTSIVRFCDVVQTTTYFDYMRKATAERQMFLERSHAAALKPYLQGQDELLPEIIDRNVAEPTPYKITKILPKVIVECKNREDCRNAYYTFTHNIEDGVSIKMSGSFYGSRRYAVFLKDWLKATGMSCAIKSSCIPITALVRRLVKLPEKCTRIYHVYLTLSKLPASVFFGFGFGVSPRKAKWAASRDLLRHLYHASLVTPMLRMFILKNSEQMSSQYSKQMEIVKCNVRKLIDALKNGGIPETYLENAEPEGVIELSVIDEIKRIVQQTSEIIINSENTENAVKRRKRKLVDEIDLEKLAKRNRCVAVVEYVGSDANFTQERLNLATDASTNIEVEQVEQILDVFGDDGCLASVNISSKPRSGIESVLSAGSFENGKTTNNSCPSKNIESNRLKSCEVISIGNNILMSRIDNVLSEKERMFSNTSEVTQSSASTRQQLLPAASSCLDEGDDDCQIIDMVEKKKPDLVMVNDSDKEDEEWPTVSDSPNQKEERSELPNRIFDDDMIEINKRELMSRRSTSPRKGFRQDHEMEMEEPTANVVEGAPELTSEMIAMRDLLGVTFNTFATESKQLVEDKKRNYPAAFRSFDEKIWIHFRKNGQEGEIFHWKMALTSRLEYVLQLLYPTAILIPVGSTVNGCGSYNSDLDLCLYCPALVRPAHTSSYPSHIAHILVKVQQQLTTHLRGFVRKAEVAGYVKAPMLRVQLYEPYDDLDINLNFMNTAAVYNSHLIHYYSNVDKRFPALCLIVKHWAIRARISDSYSGTLTGYAITLLVLHFLQCGTFPPVLPNLQFLYPSLFDKMPSIHSLQLFKKLPNPLPSRKMNTENVGDLLIEFFDYYAHFDFGIRGISIREGRIINRSDLPSTTMRHKIYVADPIDKRNAAIEVLRAPAFKLIKDSFIKARDALLSSRAEPPSLRSIGVF